MAVPPNAARLIASNHSHSGSARYTLDVYEDGLVFTTCNVECAARAFKQLADWRLSHAATEDNWQVFVFAIDDWWLTLETLTRIVGEKLQHIDHRQTRAPRILHNLRANV